MCERQTTPLPYSFYCGFFYIPSDLTHERMKVTRQHAKKVVSDSPGLVDFAIGLVNSVFNLPDGQVMFFEEFE